MAPTTGLLVVLLVAHGAFVAFGDFGRLIQWVPDDAFYYFTLARNHAESGRWTFDGASPTSGFHPLWAYLLSGFRSLGAWDDVTFIRFSVILSSALAAAAVTILARFSALQFGQPGLWAVGLVFVSRATLSCAVMAMEWSASVLATTLVVVVCFARRHSPSLPYLAFAAAFAATLSRTDSALLVGCLALASLLPPRSHVRRTATGLAALLGSVTATMAALVHNLSVTGSLLQDSSRVKAFWGHLHGYDLGNAALVLFEATSFGSLSRTAALVLITAGAALAFHHDMKRSTEENTWSDPRKLGVASAAALSAYTLLYAFNAGGTQAWYTANAVVPLVLLLSYLGRVLSDRQRLARIVQVTGVACAVAALISLHRPPWPNQRSMLAMAIRLQAAEFKELVVGSWNAGIIGYFRRAGVVNLDGLVNHDVYPFIVSGSLPAYVDLRGITLIAEYAAMFERTELRRRGGYDDPSFFRRLRLLEKVSGQQGSWLGTELGLYHLAPVAASAGEAPSRAAAHAGRARSFRPWFTHD